MLPEISSNIKGKKIIIFGVGEKAKKFVEKYSKDINIVGFTSNNVLETEFYNLKRIDISNLQLMDNLYIIICAGEINTADIENQLSLCFNFLEDFIDCDLFEYIERKRKLIIIEGICQQYWVAKALDLIPQVNDEYIVKLYWKGEIKSSVALQRKIHRLCTYADFVIRPQMRGMKEDMFLCGDASLIKMPLIYGQFLYPQFSYTQTTYLCNPSMKVSNKCHVGMNAFTSTDQNVVRLLKQGFCEEDVLAEISRHDFYKWEDIEKVLNFSVHTNAINDSIADVHLHSYFMENYKTEKLFSDQVHWTSVLVWEAVRQILSLMGIEKADIPYADLMDIIAKENIARTLERPIYPSVIKLLELEWVKEDTTYNMIKMEEIKKVSFTEYMKEYIRYVNYSLKMQEVW